MALLKFLFLLANSLSPHADLASEGLTALSEMPPVRETVTIDVFQNYDCEHCLEQSEEIVLALLHSEEALLGNIELQWHYGMQKLPEDLTLPTATLCAGEQDAGALWNMHLALLNTPQAERTEEKALAIAAHYALDTTAFGTCMETGREAEILQDITLVNNIALPGVPALVVGDEVFLGTPPIENIWYSIDKARD